MTLRTFSADVSAEDIKNFDKLTAEAQERVRLRTVQLQARIESLDLAQRLYREATTEYHNAVVNFAEDPDDGFEEAYSKARKLTRIENIYSEANARLNFEIKEAVRLGYITR